MEGEKKDIPLLKIHSSILPEENSTRPVITYYRVNGSNGKLEESFKIVGNRNSMYGGGQAYERY
jgi:hypothetical protein